MIGWAYHLLYMGGIDTFALVEKLSLKTVLWDHLIQNFFPFGYIDKMSYHQRVWLKSKKPSKALFAQRFES